MDTSVIDMSAMDMSIIDMSVMDMSIIDQGRSHWSGWSGFNLTTFGTTRSGWTG